MEKPLSMFPSGRYQPRTHISCLEAMIELRRIKSGNLPISSTTQIIIYGEINSFFPHIPVMRTLMYHMAFPNWENHFIELLDQLILDQYYAQFK